MRDSTTFSASRLTRPGCGRSEWMKCAVLAWLLLAYFAYSRLLTGIGTEQRKLVVLHGATGRPAHVAPPEGRRRAAQSHAHHPAAEPVLQQPPPRAAATRPAAQAEAPPTPAPDAADFEKDSRTGLLLPRFWQPPSGLDLDAHVERVGGEPTILVMIASYRDFQCPETVASALTRASHPERLRFVVVQQNGEGDVSCDQPPVACAAQPEQPLCVHAGSMRVFTMDAKMGVGPVYARHIGSRMYRGEAYVLQIDAHNEFVAGWDSDIVEQLRATRNEYAVLSTYLTDKLGSVDAAGHSKRRTRPIMCNSAFEGGGALPRYLRHGSQPEEPPFIKESPMLQPFWAAGFSFSRGHFVTRVPYDCCLPMIFQGEEISMGVRAWTHGYDLYAPVRSVMFHEHATRIERSGPPCVASLRHGANVVAGTPPSRRGARRCARTRRTTTRVGSGSTRAPSAGSPRWWVSTRTRTRRASRARRRARTGWARRGRSSSSTASSTSRPRRRRRSTCAPSCARARCTARTRPSCEPTARASTTPG
jgi:hypothetical protein